MSDKIKIVGELDPLLETPTQLEWNILKGASHVSFVRKNASSVSNSMINFSCNPPSPNVFVSPFALTSLKVAYRIDGIAARDHNFMGVARPAPYTVVGSGFINTDVFLGPRCAPISSVTNNLTVAINGNQISSNVNSYVHELLRYNNTFSDRFIRQSVCPMAFDMAQSYHDLVASLKNPLGTYTDGMAGYMGRRAFKPISQDCYGAGGPGTDVVALAAATAVFVYEYFEYINLAPFMFSGVPSEQALFGIQTMDIYLQLDNDLKKTFSIAVNEFQADGGLAAVMTAVIGDPALGPTPGDATVQFCYLTPNDLQMVPIRNVYPYADLVPYITAIPTTQLNNLTDGFQIVANAMQLRVVPEKVWIYIKKRKGSFSVYDSDAYCRISNVNVQFENAQGLLAGASKQQLYEICVDNGLQDAYDVWDNRVGAVVCLNFGKNIELGPSMAPGVQGTFNFALTVTATNFSTSTAFATTGTTPAPVAGTAIPWDLYVVVQNSGILTLENNTCQIMTGVISQNDVLNANSKPSLEAQIESQGAGEGGASLGGGLGRNLVKVGSTVLRGVADAADTLAPVFLGDGHEHPTHHAPRSARGSARMGGSGGTLMKGGKSLGGQMLSKSELRSLAAQ